MSSPALISVVIATRNRPQPLGQCLASIAAQTYRPIEVIVVDDGSSQATRAEYERMGPTLDTSVRWLLPAHPDGPGTGPGAARNRGIRAAQGDYVAFCDDDDIWIREDHLAVAARAVEVAGADFYFSDIVSMRSGRVAEDHVWFPKSHLLRRGASVLQEVQVFKTDLEMLLAVLAGTVIHPDCWLVRRSMLADVGGFWERLWFAEDHNLMMRLLDRANIVLFRPDACAGYRLPVGDSISLRWSSLDAVLQEVMAAQHSRLVCQRLILKRWARAGEAWALRRLATLLRAEGRAADAKRFVWQAFWTYPTVGALRDYFSGSSPAEP